MPMTTCKKCGKETYMPFTCKRCGMAFCAKHRMPELHGCNGTVNEIKMVVTEPSAVERAVENAGTFFERRMEEMAVNLVKIRQYKKMKFSLLFVMVIGASSFLGFIDSRSNVSNVLYLAHFIFSVITVVTCLILANRNAIYGINLVLLFFIASVPVAFMSYIDHGNAISAWIYAMIMGFNAVVAVHARREIVALQNILDSRGQ